MVDISIYGPSIRPQHWENIYNIFTQNSVSFELIFVGYVPPTFTLPDNFKFINTSVKAAQAVEIASRTCTGKFMMNIPDDIAYPPGMLDKYFEEYEKLENKKVMLSGVFGMDGVKFPDFTMLFDLSNPNSPQVPLCGMLETSLRRKIGSIDRNFIGTYWDLDIALRFYEMGGYIHLIEDLVLCEMTGWADGVSLGSRCHVDGPLVYELFGRDGRSPRIRPVEGFDDTDIMTINQGRVSC